MAMDSERIVVAAPMSFVGSAQRMSRWISNLWLRWTLGFAILLFWWVVILGWYVIFGLLLVPYRVVRRGARKRRLEDARHREMMLATMLGGAKVQINNVYQPSLTAPPPQPPLASPPSHSALTAPPPQSSLTTQPTHQAIQQAP
jgi:hypothetical protein